MFEVILYCRLMLIIINGFLLDVHPTDVSESWKRRLLFNISGLLFFQKGPLVHESELNMDVLWMVT
jgi:hypothetical protein